MKISIIIPVYYNEDNLKPVYNDIREKLYCHTEYDWEIVMVNDGSADNSYNIMKELAENDERIKIYSLSRNFGSHAAMLCGFANCTGDCAVVKAADLQEPTELILEMAAKWKEGNNVVLAERKGRQEGKGQIFFANFYYWIVRKTSLPTMPKTGFDVYLIDRKVIDLLTKINEKNSALTGQVLWSGFKTSTVRYERLRREIGTSKWTLRKKVRLVMDTLFSFSTLPITLVLLIGVLSFGGSCIWAAIVLILKICGKIIVEGWTTLFIFNLFSFGIIMLTLGILGEYLWRAFDASRNRPPYVIEEAYWKKSDDEDECSERKQ